LNQYFQSVDFANDYKKRSELQTDYTGLFTETFASSTRLKQSFSAGMTQLNSVTSKTLANAINHFNFQ